MKVQSNNVKKMNVNLNTNSIIEQLKKFYNENLKRKHIIITIISVILYTLTFISMMYSSKDVSLASDIAPASLVSQIRECVFLSFIIILAGITPYVPISIMGIMQAIIIVNDMVVRHICGVSFLPTLYIGGLIQIPFYSLCVSIGLYYCKLSTKKNKYYHQSSFTFNDVKKQIYEIRKDDKKVEEINKKQEEKARKIQECNVKIPYLNFVILGVVSVIMEIIGVLITKI